MHYSKKKFSLKIIFSLSFVLFFTTVKLIAQTLTVNAGPDQTICDGGSTTIGGSPTASFGTPGYSYSWAPTDGLTATTVSNPAANPTVTTTYTVTVTDVELTVLTDSVTVTVTPLPITPAPSSNSPICDGTNLNLTAAPVGGASYSWTGPNSFASSLQNPTIVAASVSAAGIYSLTVTAGGCTSLVGTTSVVVNPLPTVTGLFSPLVCNGATVAGTSFTSAPGGATFNWTNSNTSIGIPASGAGNVPAFTATNSGSTLIGGTISVTATLAGCTGPPTNYTISVKPTPIASSSPISQARCSGINCNFSLNSTVAGTTYSWTTTGTGVSGNTPGSGTVISQGVTATTSSPGTANYYVTPLAAGCVGAIINPVLTVNPIPVATATTSPLARCSGDTVSFSVSSNVAGTTFSWTTSISIVSGVSPISGTGTFVFDTVSAATSSAGTVAYLFTPVAAGCTGAAVNPIVTVNPMPYANFALPYPACQFTSNIFPSLGGTAGVFTSLPAGLVFVDSLTGEIDLTTSTPGTYDITNTIAASGGCPAINSTYTSFAISPFVDPTITDVLPVCYGDAAFNFVSASAGGTWSGTGITNTALGTFDPTLAGPGIFTITHQSSGPCFFAYTDTTVISVVAADMYGKVTYSGGDLNIGANTAVLFDYSGTFASFDSVQVSSIDGLGYYQFTSIPSGDYLIKVFADTLVCPLLIPTYYDSEYLWDTALVKTHGCLSDTANVYMIEGIVLAGPGMLSGQITEGDGFVRLPGEPIPGIDVKLGKNPSGAMVTNTQTNPTGNYAFINIPINLPGEFYTVYVDIPGLERDSTYNITVTATDYIYTQLDYKADSNSVYPTFPLATSIVSADMENQLTIFPNPTNSNTTIEYALTNSSFVKLEVVDILGKSLQSLVNTSQVAGNYKVNLAKINAGIYFIKLNINNQTNTTRLVVTD